jgi:hypothetical protein
LPIVLAAGDARIEVGAAVARALVDGDRLDRPELRLQVGEAQVERAARAAAADLDDVRVRVDRGRNAGVVIAHEEGVVRREDAVVEDLHRRFELRRPRGDDDQRALLGIGDEAPLAIGERLLEGRLGERRAAEAHAGGGSEASREKAASPWRCRRQGHVGSHPFNGRTGSR